MHPEVIGEVERLRTAAAGLAASDALAPPRDVRTGVFERARARTRTRTQTRSRCTPRSRRRSLELLDDVPASTLDRTTLNGLTVRELVVHLAAMESLLAMWLGVPTLPEVVDEGVEERTAAVIEVTHDWSFAEVTALWTPVDGRGAAPRHPADAASRWFGSEMPTDLVLVVRAFETWTHTDDIRRALGWPLDVPVGGRVAHDGRRLDDDGSLGPRAERARASRPHRADRRSRVPVVASGPFRCRRAPIRETPTSRSRCPSPIGAAASATG